MSTEQTPQPSAFSEERAKKLLEEAEFWTKHRKAKKAEPTFEDTKAQLAAALATLPDKVDVPYELTPEGERMTQFKRLMQDSPEFLQKIDRKRLPNPEAFDRVTAWNGLSPGPCAWGPTDTAKTRAAWSVVGRLYVHENKPFAWFPGRRLVNELAKYEDNNTADEFFRMYDFFKVLFVDDLDKINWQFDSQKTALFAFYDWIYRRHKPCVTTTNKDRAWWADKMGDAFARRLFDDAHFEVKF